MPKRKVSREGAAKAEPKRRCRPSLPLPRTAFVNVGAVILILTPVAMNLDCTFHGLISSTIPVPR
ncbi:hypothetical protein A6R68_17130 [Neotoma lepida]|uniref:Uncharacterized protein n=1 Tax=Neotoma lepida TaxID=56216 RepID=A0A1A6HFL6_NEOLE|nr:hypothetical protein A6R68_17130 [Neotoma lepida]